MGIKVTREMLDRYRKLKQEIPVLELELLMMKNTEAGLGNDTIFDYQTGYPRPQSVVRRLRSRSACRTMKIIRDYISEMRI